MDSKKLKMLLKEYRGYKGQNEQEDMKLESFMLSRIYSFFNIASIEKSRTNELEELLEINTENSAEDLRKLEQGTENYNVTELILYVMSNAHEDWIIRHQDSLNDKQINNAYKFVPFNLLNWKDAKKYFAILEPIFNALNVNYDEEEVKNQFDRDQLLYLIKYGIYTKEIFKEKLKKMDELYPEVLTVKCKEGVRLDQKLSEENISDQIFKEASGKISFNVSDRLKKMLKIDKDNIGFVKTDDLTHRLSTYKYADNIVQRKIGFKRFAFPRFTKAIPKTIYELANNLGIIFAKNVNKHDYNYVDFKDNIGKKVLFLTYNECTNEQKKHIEKRRRKLEKFVSKVQKSKSKKYTESGVITLVNSRFNLADNTMPEIIQFEITKKELAQIGILPSEIGWESKNKALVSSNNGILIYTNGRLSGVQDLSQNNNDKNDFHNRIVISERADKTGEKITSKKPENNSKKQYKTKDRSDD
ncbi:MAG: hypothetical protein IJ690_04575 [Clostridia bacterium]|nr:hypothetical protein [Clostridia bacterium]